MRYKIVILSTMVLVSIAPQFAWANDYAENPKMLVLNKEVPICWSIDNLEKYTDEYLFVYDYSSTTGRQVGAPWVLPVQGVCYATDLTEQLYAFMKPIAPAVADLIESTEDISPVAAVTDVLGVAKVSSDPYYGTAYYTFPAVHGYSAPAAVIPAMRYSTEEMVQMMPFKIQDVLPTRHIPDEGIVGKGALFNPDLALWADKRFLEAKEILETLAVDLGKRIAQCDTRKSLEVRSSIEFARGSTHPINGVTDESAPFMLNVYGMDVWHTERYGTIFGRVYGIPAIEVIGCTADVQAFLREHKSDTERFDALISSLDDTYSGQPYYPSYPEGAGLISFPTRESREYAELLVFAYYGKTPVVPTEQIVLSPTVARITQEIGPIATTTSTNDPSSTAGFGQTYPDATGLAEPSAPASTNNVPTPPRGESSDQAPRNIALDQYTYTYYVALPLVGLIGLTLLYVRRRSRRARHDDSESSRS